MKFIVLLVVLIALLVNSDSMGEAKVPDNSQFAIDLYHLLD